MWPFKRKRKSRGASTFKVSYKTVPEAKRAISDIRARKKQLSLLKKELNSQLAEIRAVRRAQTAQQGSKFRGRGGTARFIRDLQTTARDNDRRDYTARVNAIESKKIAVDRDMAALDRMIAEVERWISKHK